MIHADSTISFTSLPEDIYDAVIVVENCSADLEEIEEKQPNCSETLKSLAKEADESLAKHKTLELEIERLCEADCQSDIMSMCKIPSVDMNSRGKKQKANVSNTENQKKQKPKVNPNLCIRVLRLGMLQSLCRKPKASHQFCLKIWNRSLWKDQVALPILFSYLQWEILLTPGYFFEGWVTICSHVLGHSVIQYLEVLSGEPRVFGQNLDG
ncbi:hypothetical protein Tco_0169892 [Tanacetum coccineum]